MSTDNPFPQPPDNIQVKTETMAAGTKIWRVHKSQFSEAAFNPGFGDARFSPIQDASGDKIPTLYAGDTIDVALMESVFHDVPHTTDPDMKTFDISKFNDQMLSELTLTQDVVMVKLYGPALRSYGIKPAELIHSEAIEYPNTRSWAERIHLSAPDAQGIKWVSKQDDGKFAYMYFGDRVDENVFIISTAGTLLTESDTAIDRIHYLTEEMGVQLVDPGTD